MSGLGASRSKWGSIRTMADEGTTRVTSARSEGGRRARRRGLASSNRLQRPPLNHGGGGGWGGWVGGVLNQGTRRPLNQSAPWSDSPWRASTCLGLTVQMLRYPAAVLSPDVVDSPKCFVLGTIVIIVTKHLTDNQRAVPDGKVFAPPTPTANCSCVCLRARW